MASIAITAPDLLDTGASGFGMRAVGLGRALAKEHHVELLAPGDPGVDTGAAVLVHDRKRQEAAIRRSDVVVTANAVPRRLLPLARGRLVFDLYDPSVIEAITVEALHGEAPQGSLEKQLWDLRFALRHGTHVLCANEAQASLYTGMLLGMNLRGRTLPVGEQELRERFLVVPNGVDPGPLPDRQRSREQLGFMPDDVVLLWGGGVWDWLDPETVIDAVAAATAIAPSLRLVFLGLRRGGTTNPYASKAEEVWSRAQAAGLDGVVRLNEAWVGLDERGTYLAASDAGIIGQGNHLESRYSFRTRFIDCLWAGIPVVAAGSDPLTEEGVSEGWAVRCPPGDVSALADILTRFAACAPWRAELRAASEKGRERRTWERVVEPLGDAIANASRVTLGRRVRRAAEATAGGFGQRLRSLVGDG